jgi:hypothetical protein
LKEDTQKVLLALGLSGVQAFSIPSANYLRKSGIRIRLFLWNSARISCLSLKKHFTTVVDSALFSPIQPIYVARPTFVGRNDPCQELVAWIPGDQIYTDVRPIFESNNRKNPKYTKKEARGILNAKIRGMADIGEGERHKYLRDQVSYLAGKLCAQGHYDEDELKDEICEMAMMYWHGNAKKDREVIEYAFKRGMAEIEGEEE